VPRSQPLAQHGDGAAVVIRGDLVPLGRARLACARPRIAERHGGDGPDPVEFGVLGRDDPYRDPRRQWRHVRGPGEHHERMRPDLQGRLGGGRRHLRRGLLDPLEGLGDDQLTLPGANRADVRGGYRRP